MFKIIDAQGHTLSIDDLDNEAETFWGKVYRSNRGICPQNRRMPCWENIIGKAIYNAKEQNWHSVVIAMCSDRIVSSCIDGIAPRLDAFTLQEMRTSISVIQPYLDLLEFWALKGYQPRKD